MQIFAMAAPDAASLIADTGHPGFPGWQVLAAALMAATIAALLSAHPSDALRRHSHRFRVPTRFSIAANPNAVRVGRAA